MEFNLADLWEHVVDAVPDREALVFGTHRLTFRQADERANRLAHFLQEQGVGPGDHVAVYLRNRPEYVEAMFAALKLRGFRSTSTTATSQTNSSTCSMTPTPRPSSSRRSSSHSLRRCEEASPARERSSSSTMRQLTVTGRQITLRTRRRFAVRFRLGTSRGARRMISTSSTRAARQGCPKVCSGVPRTSSLPGSEVAIRRGSDHPSRGHHRVSDRPIRCLPVCPLMHGTANWFAMRTLFGGGAVILFDIASSIPSASGG